MCFSKYDVPSNVKKLREGFVPRKTSLKEIGHPVAPLRSVAAGFSRPRVAARAGKAGARSKGEGEAVVDSVSARRAVREGSMSARMLDLSDAPGRESAGGIDRASSREASVP